MPNYISHSGDGFIPVEQSRISKYDSVRISVNAYTHAGARMDRPNDTELNG